MRRIAALFALFILASPAFALPGDYDAVVQSCGKPLAESRETSPVNGEPQRSITYPNDIILRFQPEPPGWGFTAAWHGSHPAMRSSIEGLLPCFRTAMQQSQAQSGVTPTANTPTQTWQSINATAFGVPHFWLILIVGVAVFLVLIIIPGAKQRRLAQIERENAKAIADAHPPAHGYVSIESSGKRRVAQQPGGEVIPPQHRVVKHDPDL